MGTHRRIRPGRARALSAAARSGCGDAIRQRTRDLPDVPDEPMPKIRARRRVARSSSQRGGATPAFRVRSVVAARLLGVPTHWSCDEDRWKDRAGHPDRVRADDRRLRRAARRGRGGGAEGIGRRTAITDAQYSSIKTGPAAPPLRPSSAPPNPATSSPPRSTASATSPSAPPASTTASRASRRPLPILLRHQHDKLESKTKF